MSPKAGLEAQDLSLAYPSGVLALEGASFSVPRGSITALVGANGAGKSTLFQVLMGLLPHAQGQVQLLGMPMTRALKRQLVAYVPQSEGVDWSFPLLVEDLVLMGRYGHMGWLRRPRKADLEAVEAALARVGLSDLRKRQIGALSGGQRKRAFLARALAQEAQLILLDEPFTGVDVKTEDALIELLKGLRDEGRMLLVSTHNLGSVPTFCDRCILLKVSILAEGTTEHIFTPANLRLAFGDQLRHFVLGGEALHEDSGTDARRVTILSDDERPFVLYDDQEHE